MLDSDAQEPETSEPSVENESLDDVRSTEAEAIEKPIDREVSSQDAMSEYMNEHNYGRDDYAEYSKDPKWQELNSDLGGVNPVEGTESLGATSEDSTPESADDTNALPLDNVRETDYDVAGIYEDEPLDNSINEEPTNEDSPVIARDQTEQWISGNNAIDNTIEAMRDDLRDKGQTDNAQIESIVMGERARLQEELSRNIEGDFSNPYQQPDFDDYTNGNNEQSRDISFDNLPTDRQEAVNNLFNNAPDDIKDVVSDYGEALNIGSTENDDCCHYNPNDTTIRMQNDMDGAEYAEVFSHEYGHFADDQMGWASETNEFVNAVSADKGLYDRETTEGRERFNNMLNDAFSSGAAYDRMVSDNLSALFQNDQEIEERFYNEGVPYYQHSNDYWNSGRNRENEIFANSFSIRTNGDSTSIGFMNNFMPNSNLIFNNLLSSRRGH